MSFFFMQPTAIMILAIPILFYSVFVRNVMESMIIVTGCENNSYNQSN